MEKHTWLSLALFLIFALGIRAQHPTPSASEQALKALLQDPALANGHLAFSATNLDNGQMLAEHNSFKAMLPASIVKLITTHCALAILGPDYKFETKLAFDGMIENGVLEGDLIIYAGGDPTLNSKYFPENDAIKRIKDVLVAAGIKRVEGTIHYDLSIYHPHTTPRGYIWEDMGNYFGASPSALMYKDNMIPLQFSTGEPGTDAVLRTSIHDQAPYKLHHSIKASNNQADDAWFFSTPNATNVYGEGTIPANRESFTVKIADPNPVFSFHKDLEKALGYTLNHEAHFMTYQPKTAITFNVIQSPPLLRIIRVTNQESVNLFAEALLLALDKQSTQKTIDGGLSRVTDLLQKQQLTLSGLRLQDGSGASPMNRVTTNFITQLLAQAYNSEKFSDFENTLAIGGTEGTLKHYFKDPQLKGNVIGKSGSMKGTRNYAGYIINKHGERIAFACIMNDIDEGQRARLIQKLEQLLLAMINQ